MSLVDRLRLMVITDPAFLKGRDAVSISLAAVRGGATMVQVRWKDGTARDLLALTQALVGALPPAVPVLVNDRVDVALAAGAAGAHLGQDDVPPTAIRARTPPGFLLGTSVGNSTEASRTRDWPVDYWSIGSCYVTANKPDAGAPLGPGGFAALRRLAPPGMPVIGIGGINPSNAAAIVTAGAAGVAVIGAVLGAEDVEAATRQLRTALGPALSRSPSP
jgi:thiamine-phosphate pyrophosphorylase